MSLILPETESLAAELQDHILCRRPWLRPGRPGKRLKYRWGLSWLTRPVRSSAGVATDPSPATTPRPTPKSWLYGRPRQPGNYRLPGCVMYVTIEPCIMCLGALLQARIRRLVFGAADPKGGACVSLYRLPEDERLNHRLEVVAGIAEAECRDLLQDFFRQRRNSQDM